MGVIGPRRPSRQVNSAGRSDAKYRNFVFNRDDGPVDTPVAGADLPELAMDEQNAQGWTSNENKPAKEPVTPPPAGNTFPASPCVRMARVHAARCALRDADYDTGPALDIALSRLGDQLLPTLSPPIAP